MAKVPVAGKDFEFLVCKRQGFVVLAMDSAAEQTFYFTKSLGFKLVFTDMIGMSSSVENHDTPVIGNAGCKFCVLHRKGFVIVFFDGARKEMFYFNEKLSFNLVFTDSASSVIKQVDQIPAVEASTSAHRNIHPEDHSAVTVKEERLAVSEQMYKLSEGQTPSSGRTVTLLEYKPDLESGRLGSQSVEQTLELEVTEYDPDGNCPSEPDNNNIASDDENRSDWADNEKGVGSDNVYSEESDSEYLPSDDEALRGSKREEQRNTNKTRPKRKIKREEDDESLSVYFEESEYIAFDDEASGVNQGNQQKKTNRNRPKRKKKREEDKDYEPDEEDEEENDDPDDEKVLKDEIRCGPRPPKIKGEFPCDKCEEVFEYMFHLNKHKRKIHPQTFPCDLCNEVLSTAFRLRKHKRHTHPVQYTCDLCGETFKNKYWLKMHNRQAHKEVHQCHLCSEVFKTDGGLRKHNKVIHKVKTTEESLCPHCGICYKGKSQRWNHKCAKQPPPIFRCKLCEVVQFESYADLHRHLKQKHLHDKNKWGKTIVKPCLDCDKAFFKPSQLKLHARSHEAILCAKCGRTFRNRSALTQHLLAHNLNRCYQCTVCKEEFHSANALSYHRRRYHGTRHFNCEDCGRIFSHLKNIARHMVSHTKDQPFICEVCGKCFSQGYNLTCHMRTHTKVKAFKCDFCDLAFGHKCSLEGHLRSKHKGFLQDSW